MIDSLYCDDRNEGLGRSWISGYDVIVAEGDIIAFEYSVFSGL